MDSAESILTIEIWTPERFQKAVRSLASSGVTHFFPTLITASHERILHQLKLITQALEGDRPIKRMCPGIHLEGPYLNPEDGPRGVHPKEFIRNPQWDEILKLPGGLSRTNQAHHTGPGDGGSNSLYREGGVGRDRHRDRAYECL